MAAWKSTAARLADAARRGLARIGGLSSLALAFMLVLAVARFPGLTDYARLSLPVLRLWPDGEAQRRAAAVDFPYILLGQADALLPPDAAVLLVTPGREVRRGEYTTYHRALYYLAPRPVWWLAPAAPDGTWESRWWISAPLTAASIRAAAREKGAGYVLGYNLPAPPELGMTLAATRDGYLLQVDESSPPAAPAGPRPEETGAFWPLRLVGAVAVLFALGHALLAVAERAGFAAYGVEAAALAWLLGAGGASLGMFWLGLLGLPLRWQVTLLSLLAIAAFASRKRSRRPALAQPAPPRRHPLRVTHHELRFSFHVLPLAFIALLYVTLASLLALGRPLAVWDSWANWGVKARALFIENGLASAVFSDPARAATHLDYPLALPLSQAWLYVWLGAPDDRFAGLIPLLFYLALAGLAYGGARRLGAGPKLAAAGAVAALALPNLALLAGFAFADVPLAALALAAGIYLWGWLEGGPAGMLALAAFAGGLLPWVKREGAVLLAALCLAALVSRRGSRRAWLGVAALAGAAALGAGPWWALTARAGQASADFLPLRAETLAANLNRLPAIARLALAGLFSADWLYLWPLAAAAGLALWLTRRAAGRGLLLPLAALFYLGAMGAAFIFSAYAPFQQHILSAWYRLAAHAAPWVLLWLAGAASAAHPAHDP